MLNQLKQDLSVALLEIGAVKFGEFRLKLHEKNPTAPLSPIYVDLRLLRSFPKAFHLAIATYESLINGPREDLLADIPTAATPFVGALAYTLEWPMVSPRLGMKSHGTQQYIEGAYASGQSVLLIDDLITKAESKFDAIGVLEGGGLRVARVVVLVDREQGGAAELSSRGYGFRAAMTLSELLNFYRTHGLVTESDYSRTIAYLSTLAK